jgi:hypothetical protein
MLSWITWTRGRAASSGEPLHRPGADRSRRAEAGRLKLRSEMLLAGATCLSAIAACGAVVTALRQEHAIFASTLYSKQVDSFASFDVEVGNYALYSGKLEDALQKIDLENPNIDEAREISKLSEQVKESVKRVEIAGTQLFILLPKKAAENVSDSQKILYRVRNIFGQITEKYNLHSLDKVDLEKDLSVIADFEKEYDKSAQHLILCAAQSLSIGQSIGSDFDQCVPDWSRIE